MKTRLSLLSTMFVCVLTLSAQTVERSFYFDFGMSGGTRGTITTGADIYGHYWNNIGDQEVTSNKPSLNHVYNLVDADNTATTLTLQLAGTQFTANGMSGGGGLLSADTALLGDLGITTATEDYLFASNSEHCSMVISGLNTAKGYQFKIFASRTATDVRISDYTLRGQWAIQGSLQAAGSGIGANGENQNTSNVWLSPVIKPASDGTITLTVHRQYAGSGAYFPISCMRMQEMTNLHVADKEIYIDCGHSDGNNGELTASPDDGGIYWNNIYENATSAAAVSLVYSDNQSVGANVTITSGFSRNGYNNGGNTAATYPAILGAFAKKTVMGDYFFINGSAVGKMRFNNMNPDKAYVFYIIGSRAYNSSFGQTVDHIKIEGLTESVFTHHTGGNGLCYSGASNGWNEDAFSVSDPLFPAEDGTLTLSLSIERGSYVHINGIRIEEYSDYEKPAPAQVEQYSRLLIKGTAVEGGEVEMHLRAADGKTEGTSFETFLRMTNGGTLSFEKPDGTVLSSTTCALENGIYRIVYNTTTKTFTSLAINRVGIVGNVTTAGWNAAGVELTYRGNGIWRDTLDLVAYNGSDAERGQFCMNSSWDYTVKARNGEEGIVGFTPDQTDCGFTVSDIYMRHGRKDIMLDMQQFVYSIECMEIADNKITFFGSSVCNGQGADDMHGYAYQYGQLLAARHAADSSLPEYEYSNASINGNNTLNLLARYKGHMFGDCGKYVVIGLGLGNEGLHEATNKQATYNQWKHNMDSLINIAQDEGKVVIATNNYPRGDYNATDYGYVKQMNLEMQEWNIPTVNLLGALDNCKGDGQWADNYQVSGDVYHPTTEGHTEFMHTIVPSLFDALEANKPMPTRQTGEGLALASTDTLVFLPEDRVHSFTLAMRLKIASADNVILLYTDEGKKTITLPSQICDNGWHTLMMTHYYAAGKTYYYIDGTLGNSDTEQLLLNAVRIGGADMRVSDLHFWRSAMNAEEAAALHTGKMLCSSLEIYAPLNNASLANIAQSTNTLYIAHASTQTSLTSLQTIATAEKRIENGNLIIIHNNIRYNILGAELK